MVARLNSAQVAAKAGATNLSDPSFFKAADFGSAQSGASGWLALLEGESGTAGTFLADPRFGAAPQAAPNPPVDNEHLRLTEAFERGLAQGRAESAAQAEAEVGERRKLGIALRTLEQEMRDQFAAMLAETVKALCSASFAPIALDKELLQSRCVRAATMLDEAQDAITLRLNPDDIARIDPEFADSWTIAPDPDLPQGELRVEGRDGAVLDGPQEWARALAEALEIC